MVIDLRFRLPRSPALRCIEGHKKVHGAKIDLEPVPRVRRYSKDEAVDASKVRRSNLCLCGRPMKVVLDLPDFPLTEVAGKVDQKFLFCQECTHGKLEVFVSPEVLYTKPSKMGSDRSYLDRFAHFVKNHGDFPVIVDIGGNDGSLLERFSGIKIAIDPQSDGIKKTIEEADLFFLKDKRKLILSSHTLEHLQDPSIFASKVSQVMGPDDLLAIQIPSMELMVEDGRLDHIHNQHLHYFSERSLTTLLKTYGLEVIEVQFNPDHWGALMVVAKKGEGKVTGRKIEGLDLAAAILSFTGGMAHLTYKLHNRKFIAYGEGQMFPILSYWLPSLNDAEFIADDSKGPFILRDRDVVVTAVSSKMTARLLVMKAFEKGARNVFTPFNQL